MRPSPNGSRAALGLLLAATLLHPEPALARRKRGIEPGVGAPVLETNAQALYQLGATYFQQGLLGQARDSLSKCLELQPGYAEAQYLIGLVALAQRDHAAAVQHLEGALATNPFFTEAHNALGMAYSEMGDTRRALTEFRIVLTDQNYPTPEVPHFNIGRLHMQAQRYEAACQSFQRASEVNPKFGRALFQYGVCLERTGKLREAREAYERAVDGAPAADIEPEIYQFWYRLGLVCYDLQDAACACENLRKALDLGPGPAEAARARDVVARACASPVRVLSGARR